MIYLFFKYSQRQLEEHLAKQQQQQQPQQQISELLSGLQPLGSSSVSTSHSPEGFSSSSAAALGSGASSSTSSRSGVVPEDLEEHPYDNRYYPCLGNDCEAETDYENFSQDYRWAMLFLSV